MKKDMNSIFVAKIQGFRLPRYNDLPNMGLYLEQVVKYINGVIATIGCPEITSSMVSNYVKKDVIDPPIKKQYYAEQIGYLLFISVVKSVLSIEQISKLFDVQKTIYEPATAYDYFCAEFENILAYNAGITDKMGTFSSKNTNEKSMLRSAIIAATQVVFLNVCFSELDI